MFPLRCSLLLLLLAALCSCQERRSDPQIDFTPEQFILAAGYPAEVHDVPTADGFLLRVARIPRSGSSRKGVVVLQHGLLDSAATWLMNGPRQALGFILYDAGYDVWLPNQRGNRYSNKMKDGGRYNWMWSVDELAKYDAPAVLQYVTNTAQVSKVTAWIGHSRGTQQIFFGLASLQEQMAQKMSLFVALAPVAYIGNVKVPLIKEIALLDSTNILSRFGYNDFLPKQPKADGLFCKIFTGLCEDILGAIVGPIDKNNFNATRLPVYLAHFPAGTSSQEMAHYAQMVNDDDVRAFDYGSAKINREHYGSATPPYYEIEKIPTHLPIALFTANNDALADPIDVSRLIARLGAQNITLHNNQPTWNHMDFVWGTTAASTIYPIVIDLLNKH